MNAAGEERVSADLRRFYGACEHRQPAANALLVQGRAARVLAASKPGGLLLNVEAPELTFFIAHGMDITSQLVSVISDPEVHAALKACMRDDIRVSVHAQHPVEFLGDVRDHRFDLVTFGLLTPPEAGLAVASLAPGGILAVFPDAAVDGTSYAELEKLLADSGMMISRGPGDALVAARTPEHLEARRRGGRRKRPPAHR